mgnify:CR=1 FL=1
MNLYLNKNLKGIIDDEMYLKISEIKKTEFTNKEAHAILINELNSRTKK